MTVFRIVFLVGALLLSGGAGYLAWAGVGGESGDLDRTVRQGSVGNLINSDVK